MQKNVDIIIEVVIECPDSKLVLPVSVLPIIVKLSLSNIAVGLGTANIFFNKADTINEVIDDVNNTSHNLGAKSIKILNKE